MDDPKKAKLEQYPDAWSRFERAIDVVAKSPPQHRTKEQKQQSRKIDATKPKAKPSEKTR